MTIRDAAQGVAMQLHVLLEAVKSGNEKSADVACAALAGCLANLGNAIAAEARKHSTTTT